LFVFSEIGGVTAPINKKLINTRDPYL